MADSASDPKVDDVLSSVRRLVSQEMPKRAMPKSTVDPGALVLSSKDRIEAEHQKRVATQSLEQRIAELEAAVDKSTAEFEPDGSEDEALHRPDRIVYTRPRSSETATDPDRRTLRLSEIALLQTASEPEQEPIDSPVEFRRGTSKAPPEAPMAEDVPPLPAVQAEVRAFSDPDDVVARIEARIARGGDLYEPDTASAGAPETAKVDQPLETAAEQVPEVDGVRSAEPVRPTPEISQDVQAFETPEDVQTESPPKVEVVAPEVLVTDAALTETEELMPAPAESDEPSPETELETSVDVAQAAVLTARAKTLNDLKSKPEPEPDTSDTAVKENLALARANTALATLADEDAMRLLVGRLLREELQGQLGEDITHNVRKLVRSEINRKLQSRALD